MRTSRLLIVSYSIRGGGLLNPPPETDPPGCRHPPVNRQTGVKTLSCPKLRLLAVTKGEIQIGTFEQYINFPDSFGSCVKLRLNCSVNFPTVLFSCQTDSSF